MVLGRAGGRPMVVDVSIVKLKVTVDLPARIRGLHLQFGGNVTNSHVDAARSDVSCGNPA
jgi:hypothetical protein